MNTSAADHPIFREDLPVRVTLDGGYWFCGRFLGWDGEDTILVRDRLGSRREICIGVLEEVSCRHCQVPNDLLVEYLNDRGEGFVPGWTVPEWAKARGKPFKRDVRSPWR